MKVCIYGAGAIGGFLGARLSAAGNDVTLIARGPHLEALQGNGLTLVTDNETLTVRIEATDDPATLPRQDIVFVTLKAQSVGAVAAQIAELCDERTIIVPAVNGVPWWYFHRLQGPYEDHHLQSVDPGDRQWSNLKPERVIGCVVYPACEIDAPGVIRHIEGDRFSLGEPSGEKTERLRNLSTTLRDAGLKAPVKAQIRDEIWVKLWGNVAFNPLSVIYGATLEEICLDPNMRARARAIMVEAQAIGEALGARFSIDVEKRIAGAQAVGAHKTSMLQDFELGRAMEIDAIIGAVRELGQLVSIPTPAIDEVFDEVATAARQKGCY